MKMMLVVLMIAAACAPLACRAGEPSADAAARIAAAVQTELDAKLFPGAVVLIGTKDKVLYHEAFGLAQLKPKSVPMQKDSIFDIASVTKVVCAATAVAICKDRGLIDPDAPLTKYLPDYSGKDADKITLRRLASHTSGFPDFPRVAKGGKGEALFEELLKYDPKWAVNAKYEYSCRNIILLSTIVERVTGKSFGQFCADEIFKPLEMTESIFDKVPPGPRIVATHHKVLGENSNEDGRNAQRALGNAGLFTTARDLGRFCEMMLNGGTRGGNRVLTPETIADFTALNQLPKFPGHGFIWKIGPAANDRPARMSERAYGHSGFTGMSLWIDPDKQVYAVVLTNRTLLNKEPATTPRGIDQYKARGRITSAALEALGY